MYESKLPADLSESTADSLVSAARTSIGDTLRSVIYFTPAEMALLYVRRDLYESRDGALEVKSRLVEFERVGFAEAPVRTALSVPNADSGIGPYEFTVRFHDDGYVVRILSDVDGVILTTDDMDVDAFEDAVTAIARLLSEE